MKRRFSLLAILLALAVIFSACNLTFQGASADSTTAAPDSTTAESTTDNTESVGCEEHKDVDDDGECDVCQLSVFVSIDFYAVNDLHGKFKDTSTNGGVDELTTYLILQSLAEENTVFLSVPFI